MTGWTPTEDIARTVKEWAENRAQERELDGFERAALKLAERILDQPRRYSISQDWCLAAAAREAQMGDPEVGAGSVAFDPEDLA